MKKNTAALVLAILSSVFGLIGGVMWAACAEACAGAQSSLGMGNGGSVGYMVGFILLGIGGALLSLIGGIQAFTGKTGRVALSVFGLLLQVGCLILQCVSVEGFLFTFSLCTIVAILLALLQTIFAARKQ